MTGQSIETRRVTYRVHPEKVAILIPLAATWEDIQLLIADASLYWGGHLTMFIPTDGQMIDSLYWQFLQLYDPDNVYYIQWGWKSGSGPSADLLAEIGTRICLFRKPSACGPNAEVRRLGSVRLPVILADGLMTTDLVIPDTSGLEPFLAICYGDSMGFIGDDDVRVLKNTDRSSGDRDLPSIDVTYSADNLSLPYARKSESSDFGPIHAMEYQLGFTVEQLGSMEIYPDSPDAPAFLVFGNTVQDYCLYRNLRILTNRAYWLPRLVDQKDSASTKKHLWALKLHACQLLSPYTMDHANVVQVLSRSVDREGLEQACHALIDQVSVSSHLSEGDHGDILADGGRLSRFEIMADICPQLSYYVNYVQINNIINEYSIFYYGRMANIINTPIIKGLKFNYPLYNYGWIVEIIINGYMIPSRALLLDGHLEDIDRQSCRLTRQGLAFRPRSPLVISYEDIASLIRRPRLALLDDNQLFTRLLAESNYSFKISDKGTYLRKSLQWFESISHLLRFLENPDNQKVLNLYLDTKTPTKPGDHQSGCLLGDRRYLDFAALCKVLSSGENRGEARAATLLQEWLDLGLLHRGIALQCSSCAYSDWYRLGRLTESFTCPRCSVEQNWTVDHARCRDSVPPEPKWYYQLDEIFFLFIKNNGFVTIAALADLEKRAQHSLMYLPEMGIYEGKMTQGKPMCEVDFVACVDGRLVIGECKRQVGKITPDLRKQLEFYKKLGSDVRFDQFLIITLVPMDDSRQGQLRQIMGSEGGQNMDFTALAFPNLVGIKTSP
jgi:hypothetical protein